MFTKLKTTLHFKLTILKYNFEDNRLFFNDWARARYKLLAFQIILFCVRRGCRIQDEFHPIFAGDASAQRTLSKANKKRFEKLLIKLRDYAHDYDRTRMIERHQRAYKITKRMVSNLRSLR